MRLDVLVCFLIFAFSTSRVGEVVNLYWIFILMFDLRTVGLILKNFAHAGSCLVQHPTIGAVSFVYIYCSYRSSD